ncbi:MAG: hypothetical protein H0V66_06365 [Bdellovibrionales bacterium]|nr:hypothetical protein [Bdellovibrionales bacterium]
MKLILISLFVMASAFARNNDVTHRPKSFPHDGAKAVFVDFTEAVYDITYDISSKKAEVKATFKMNIVEEGFPIFDLIEAPTSVKVDGLEVKAPEFSTPSNETKIRIINKKLSIGSYDLEVKVPLTNLIEYTADGVKSAFWVTDLEDRYYLERYLPVNLEYDRVKMTFNLNYKGLKKKQHIFANGEVSWSSETKAKIEFPEYFTVNSLYFHTTPVGSVKLLEATFKSVNGRDIPVAVYMADAVNATATLTSLKDYAQRTMIELEGDYGAFPHASLIIYNADLTHMGLGGMEYAGATVTNEGALEHEMFHSYFARGVTPANGNAGWIDEALASWRDGGYRRRATLTGTSSMAAHAAYTRKTDTAAYGFGAEFMSFLDHKFAAKGGLKPFMNKLLEKKIFEPMFTEDFIKEMELFFGEKVQDVFNKYVYSKPEWDKLKNAKSHQHRKLSHAELQSIL